MAWMNCFHVLRQVYRHQRSKHSRFVRMVAGLVNRRIAERPLNVNAGAGVSRMTGWRAGQLDSLTESTSYPLSRHKSIGFSHLEKMDGRVIRNRFGNKDLFTGIGKEGQFAQA